MNNFNRSYFNTKLVQSAIFFGKLIKVSSSHSASRFAVCALWSMRCGLCAAVYALISCDALYVPRSKCYAK